MILRIGIGAISAAKLSNVVLMAAVMSVHQGIVFECVREGIVGEETFEYKVQTFRLGLGVDASKMGRVLCADALSGWRVIHTNIYTDPASVHGSVYVVMMERIV